jgi:hypothetical protein
VSQPDFPIHSPTSQKPERFSSSDLSRLQNTGLARLRSKFVIYLSTRPFNFSEPVQISEPLEAMSQNDTVLNSSLHHFGTLPNTGHCSPESSELSKVAAIIKDELPRQNETLKLGLRY